MLPTEKLEDLIGLETRALIATHMWGNPENMEAVVRICKERDVFIIEDACLALGSISQGKMAGSQGHVGVFSFGCLKPIQGGEGGMIVTNDSSLARELRSLRHWGDRTIEYGVRDATQLAWNGRMSEIVAAVVHEQLKGYPSHLSGLRDSVSEFVRFISEIDGLELVLGESTSIIDCAFTQVVLRIDEEKFGCSKKVLRDALLCRGVVTWHANFELINSLSFFREDSWVDWVIKGDIERARNNYHSDFFVAQKTYESGGLGLPKTYFLSKAQLHNLKKKISIALIECKKRH